MTEGYSFLAFYERAKHHAYELDLQMKIGSDNDFAVEDLKVHKKPMDTPIGYVILSCLTTTVSIPSVLTLAPQYPPQHHARWSD